MKPRPYSITGKFVEKLKAPKQDSTEEENSQIYSEYVPKYIQKDWQRFFTKQIYAFGKDILYERNLLLEYGFTKQKPPGDGPGTSQYSLTEQDDKIILWGFGMIFATKNDAVFLWRHEFIQNYFMLIHFHLRYGNLIRFHSVQYQKQMMKNV